MSAGFAKRILVGLSLRSFSAVVVKRAADSRVGVASPFSGRRGRGLISHGVHIVLF